MTPGILGSLVAQASPSASGKPNEVEEQKKLSVLIALKVLRGPKQLSGPNAIPGLGGVDDAVDHDSDFWKYW